MQGCTLCQSDGSLVPEGHALCNPKLGLGCSPLLRVPNQLPVGGWLVHQWDLELTVIDFLYGV